MTDPNACPNDSHACFQKKVWTIIGIVTLTILVLLVLKTAFNILLLILAGALIAILFRGTALYMVRKTGIRTWIAMTITLLGTALILTAIFGFAGSRLQREISTLAD